MVAVATKAAVVSPIELARPDWSETQAGTVPLAAGIEVHVTLPQQAGKTMMQIVGSIAHGQDDNRELWPHRRAHRSLDDASTAIRCPINVRQAATTSAASSTFVAAPATKRSTMAAISTRIDNSTEWKTR